MTVHDNAPRPPCPYCGSRAILKNGSTHHKKQKFLCKDCRRQFIENPQKKIISEEQKTTVKNLLLERISLAGIARALKVSKTWLQGFVNSILASIPCHISIEAPPEAEIILECDELWSYVKSKENQEWIWLALERKSRRIVGAYIGNRSRESAKKLWESIPESWQRSCVVYTDGLESYCEAIPKEIHQPKTKEKSETNHIERFNNTLRQRCSRLVRKGLSYSKKFFNHEGALWYFIHHYNAIIDAT
jgi:IS1 family transposase/transposase-like protein